MNLPKLASRKNDRRAAFFNTDKQWPRGVPGRRLPQDPAAPAWVPRGPRSPASQGAFAAAQRLLGPQRLWVSLRPTESPALHSSPRGGHACPAQASSLTWVLMLARIYDPELLFYLFGK